MSRILDAVNEIVEVRPFAACAYMAASSPDIPTDEQSALKAVLGLVSSKLESISKSLMTTLREQRS